jgi:predicted nucleic acid-binding protein
VTVVSNSSPLITLARIGQLRLIEDFYGRIVIQTDVHQEVVVAGRGLPGAEEVSKADWIEVRSVPAGVDPKLWQNTAGLGDGERSAILLANSLPADLLLLDEWKARRIAQTAGLSVVGCIGILEAAARAGRISDLRLVYVDLLKQGIRFDLEMLRDSLARLGLPEL